MVKQKPLEKEVSPFVVGIIALIFMFGGALLGGRAGNLITVLGGWGLGIGFVVMMWKRTDASAKVVLIALLVIAVSISARLNTSSV